MHRPAGSAEPWGRRKRRGRKDKCEKKEQTQRTLLTEVARVPEAESNRTPTEGVTVELSEPEVQPSKRRARAPFATCLPSRRKKPQLSATLYEPTPQATDTKRYLTTRSMKTTPLSVNRE